MDKKTILFADNNQIFLETRSQFLEKFYYVMTAENENQVAEILNNHKIDLAIIDLRFRNDEDQYDESGLTLAKQMSPSIPKLILTYFPTAKTARDALISEPLVGPIAEDYISKEDGPDVMLEAVRKALRRQIFIGHGHDEIAKKAVQDFVQSIGFRDVVLSEVPKQGRTVIELLEEYSDVTYAIIILSADDIGGLLTAEGELQPRARQNVIFEWGYFLGKLGRRHVGVLLTDQIEIPSNNSGVVCITMDNDSKWKAELAREMQSCGLNVRNDNVR